MFETSKEKYKRYFSKFGDMSQELHQKYDAWLEDQYKRPGAKLVPFGYDPSKHPEQNIYIPKIEAKDPFGLLPDFIYYARIRKKLAKSLGATAFDQLVFEMSNHPVSEDDSTLLIDRLRQNQAIGRNTMVVTSHFDFPELGYFKALRFYAKRDRSRKNMGGVLLSKMMTRQTYDGKKLVDNFLPVSNVYFSYPRTENAKKFEIPPRAMMLGNALFMEELKESLEKGGLEMDIALTGRQIMQIFNEDGVVDHYEMPTIDDHSIRLVKEFDDIVGATLIKSPINNEWQMEIGNLININESLKTGTANDVVAGVYKGIVSSVENITHKEVDARKLFSNLGKAAISGIVTL